MGKTMEHKWEIKTVKDVEEKIKERRRKRKGGDGNEDRGNDENYLICGKGRNGNYKKNGT